MAAIEHHTSASDAQYTNSYAQGRLDYLSVTGSPMTFFDGQNVIAGGCAGDCATPYKVAINKAMLIKSPLKIGIASAEGSVSGVYDVTVTLDKRETIINDALRVALVLTESHIDHTWGTPVQETLESINRRIYPDEDGKIVNLKNFNFLTEDYVVDASSYNTDNCDLIAYVYDFDTKVVYQTQIVALGETIGTSVREFSTDNSILTYPNPSKGVLKVDISNGTSDNKYQIKSLVGVTLMEGKLNNGNNTINISSLTNGNYIFIVNNTVKKITLIK